MAVIQVPLEIPDEIYARVLSGDLVHLGGVIRDHGGHLVKLLEEPGLGEAREAAKAGFNAALKNRSAVGIAVGVAVVAAAAGGAAYRARRTRELPESSTPRHLKGEPDSLATYLDAARRGSLTAEIIDRLIMDLEAGRTLLWDDTIEQVPQESGALVLAVAVNTLELADANGHELEPWVRATTPPNAGTAELRRYLEVQRGLFSEVS
jgi:hypothetical protein